MKEAPFATRVGSNSCAMSLIPKGESYLLKQARKEQHFWSDGGTLFLMFFIIIEIGFNMSAISLAQPLVCCVHAVFGEYFLNQAEE